MVRKVVVSASIFILLVAAAWFFQEQSNRQQIEFMIKNPEPAAESLFAPVPIQAEESEVWRFKPREYIKVRKENIEENID